MLLDSMSDGAFSHPSSRRDGEAPSGLVIAPSILLSIAYVLLLWVVSVITRVVHVDPFAVWSGEGRFGLTFAGTGIVVGMLMLGYVLVDFWRYRSRGLAWRFPHAVASPGAVVMLLGFLYFLALNAA